MPARIQRKRAVGWRMPEGAVYVGRPTKWGNPVTRELVRRMWNDQSGPCTDEAWRTEAVRAYREAVLNAEDYVPTVAEIRAELAGRDLACFCPLDQPCHADVLLALSNQAEVA